MELFISGTPYPKDVTGNRKETASAWTEKVVSATKALPKVTRPCLMEIEFRIPQDRFTLGSPYGPDLDNLSKRLLDSLKLTILSDVKSKDGCVMGFMAQKRPVPREEDAGVSLKIIQLSDAPDDARFVYFAYGSNMHRGWLENRVGGVYKIGNALLPRHVLRSNKKSDDGSAKTNVQATGVDADQVWGVLWSVEEARQKDLDDAEGYHPGRHDSHYKPQKVIVFDAERIPHLAITYVACKDKILPTDEPMYTWYHELITKGASENRLPGDYLSTLGGMASIKDPDVKQDREKREILDRWPPA